MIDIFNLKADHISAFRSAPVNMGKYEIRYVLNQEGLLLSRKALKVK